MIWPGSAQRFAPDLEFKFQQSFQRDLPARSLRSFTCFFFIYLASITAKYLHIRNVPKHWESQSASFTWAFHLTTLGLTGLLCLQSALHLKGMLPTCMKDIEIIFSLAAALLKLLWVIQNDWRSARMLGDNPIEVWNTRYFDDTSLCLGLVLVANVVIVYVRVRSYLAWIPLAAGILSLGISTIIFGGPHSSNIYFLGLRHFMCYAFMIIVYVMTWQGGSYIEKMERSRFVDFLAASTKAEEEAKRGVEESVKAEEERKRAVEERVLRFNAERELDQSKGTWYPTSSGANPAQLMNNWLVGEAPTHRPSHESADGERDIPVSEVASSCYRPPIFDNIIASGTSSAGPSHPGNIDAHADQPDGEFQTLLPWHGDLQEAQVACFLPIDSPLLCENPWKPGSVVMRSAANAGGMRVLVLDNKVFGKPRFVKVRRVRALHPVELETQLRWCVVSCGTLGNDQKMNFLLANSLLTHSSQTMQWRDPVQLNFVTDKICGLYVPCIASEECLDVSSGITDSRHLPSISEVNELLVRGDNDPHGSTPLRQDAIRSAVDSCNVNASEVSLTVFGKAKANAPPMLVAVELETVHPLLVGCSGMHPTNLWVALRPSPYKLSGFKCSL
eukprot:gnl/MRDRNA2_/MRDRNA2_98902_c0_seq1.p1 gnl/MRDRNA2_/MRDRNA2_98902_c0~~gnl/MRDRNA2_/MRDRNA2_98902_c0_seq1.p1  ORF type:complete len:616 (-),score=67.88 gnl/MRDRNA2_/MRDRNA2_98902_c0_seq1:568-2415(-)